MFSYKWNYKWEISKLSKQQPSQGLSLVGVQAGSKFPMQESQVWSGPLHSALKVSSQACARSDRWTALPDLYVNRSKL